MAEQSRDWLVDAAFPLWMERGVDWRGLGYFDSLDHVRLDNGSGIKRLRTLTRQIYAFCEAERLSVPRAREAVEHGLRFLLGEARRPQGGYYLSFDLAGRPTSDDLDTYDLAFVLFALRHAYRLTAERRLLDEAESLLLFMERTLRDEQGGFAEGEPRTLPRRQNPHMHLFEACLAWMEVEPEGPFRRVADELLGLFADRFFDARAGAVLEYFGPDLRFQPGPYRDAIEPGHLFEWIWLLSRYAHLSVDNGPEFSDRLYAFAHRRGVDPATGLLIGELDRSGAVRDRSVRLWPHAEWVRAEAIRLRDSEPGTRQIAHLASAYRSLRRFIDGCRPGLWHERYLADRQAFDLGPAPATSLYHLVGAFTALLDVSDDIKKGRDRGLLTPTSSPRG